MNRLLNALPKLEFHKLSVESLTPTPFLTWVSTPPSLTAADGGRLDDLEQNPGLEYALNLVNYSLSTISDHDDGFQRILELSGEERVPSLLELYQVTAECDPADLQDILDSTTDILAEFSRNDSRGHLLGALVLYEMRSLVNAYQKLLACFAPLRNEHIVLQKWRGVLSGMLVAAASAASFIIAGSNSHPGPGGVWFVSDIVVSDADLETYNVHRPDTAILECSNCRNERAYTSIDDCVSHFREVHISSTTYSWDLDYKRQFFWIRHTRQLRAERLSFALLEQIASFGSTVNQLRVKAMEIQEGVTIDNGIRDECFMLPESLLHVLKRTLHHLLLSYRSLVDMMQVYGTEVFQDYPAEEFNVNANTSTQSLLASTSLLRHVGSDALRLMDSAQKDLLSMAYRNRDESSIKHRAASIESILVCALMGLTDRALAEYLSPLRLYEQQLSALVSSSSYDFAIVTKLY
jgi:hypothetical protein